MAKGTIHRQDLVSIIDLHLQESGVSPISKSQIDQVLCAFELAISSVLVRGERVRINGIGILEVAEVRERIGRNPRTGEEILLPASRRIKFSMSNIMKRRLNKGE